MPSNKIQNLTTQQIRLKTITSFLFFILFLEFCVFGWQWLHRQPDANGVPQPVRTVLDNNEKIFQHAFSNNHIAKAFTISDAAPKVRVNGDDGLGNDFKPENWKLQVIKSQGDTLKISLDEIKTLPKTEIIFDFKCIEGWDQITHWSGVKFSDFAKKYGLEKQANYGYVGLNTPDKKYYVGIDSKSILHPQTILCYEMNGQPLPMNQGYPLRLIIPVKYGVKHLKRIGTIFFSSQRPPDFWFERGYDYYAGL